MPTDEEIAAQKAEQDAAAKAADEAAAKAKADETADLGDAGKEAIRKEREARKAAEKERDELKRQADEAAAAKAKADEEQAAKNGEFEQLAEKRGSDLEKAKAQITTLSEERDALAERVKAYEDRDTERLTTALKDLPDDLKDSDPINFDPNVSLDARLKWLDVQQAKFAKRTTDPVRGNGRSPEAANGRDAKADADALRQFERQTSRSF